MSSIPPTIGDHFRELRADLAAERHRSPGLFHCWLHSRGELRPDTRDGVLADCVGLPIVTTTRWPNPHSGTIHTSCFLGEPDLYEKFRPNAQEARRNLVLLLGRLNRDARHTSLGPVEAWMADLCRYLPSSTGPPLFVRRQWVCQWPRCNLPPYRILLTENNEASQEKYQRLCSEHGEPLTVFGLERLEQDVFTASIVMIDDLLDQGQNT